MKKIAAGLIQWVMHHLSRVLYKIDPAYRQRILEIVELEFKHDPKAAARYASVIGHPIYMHRDWDKLKELYETGGKK